MNAIQEVGVTAAIGSRRVAAVALAAATACHSEPVDEPLLPLAPVATVTAPLSHNRAIALTDDNTACVINSFELQIHCVDRMELDASTGQVLWTRGVEDLVAACPPPRPGPPGPRGGWVLMGCEGKLVFMDHRDAESARVVESPTYVEELPNERDVAAHLGIYRRMADWTGMALPATEVRESEREFRETPKMWFLRGNALVFNGQDRLWVATNRDRDTFSYFDIWVGTGYDGTVQIRDRLMGFDLLGSTLVALVERKPGPDGIAQRAIDWYDIGGLEFGQPNGQAPPAITPSGS